METLTSEGIESFLKAHVPLDLDVNFCLTGSSMDVQSGLESDP